MLNINHIRAFANDEAGAITVDWVVLTSAIVLLGVVVMLSVGGGTKTLAGKLSGELDTISVQTY